MYVMKIIFHVHLTKTDFENIKLLHLTKLTLVSCEHAPHTHISIHVENYDDRLRSQ